MLPVGDDERGKVIPEVVVTAPRSRGVIIDPFKEGRLGCFADIIRLVVAEENVDPPVP
jgi:hypothetical protein